MSGLFARVSKNASTIIGIPISIGLYRWYRNNKDLANRTTAIDIAANRNRINNDHDFTATLKHTISGKINTISSLKNVQPSKLRLFIENGNTFYTNVRAWYPLTNKWCTKGDCEELTISCWMDDKGMSVDVAEKCVSIAFSPDGQQCAIASSNKAISYWYFYNWDSTYDGIGYRGAWRSSDNYDTLVWLSDTLLAMSSKGVGEVGIFNRRTRNFEGWLNPKEQPENKNLTTRMNTLPNGDLLTATTDNNIRLWNPVSLSEPCETEKAIFPTPDLVTALIAVDDDTVLYGMQNGSLAMINLESKTSTILLEDKYKIPVTAVSVLSSGLVVKGNTNGTIVTFDPLTRKVIHEFKAHDSQIVSLIALPGNKLVSSGSTTVSVWE